MKLWALVLFALSLLACGPIDYTYVGQDPTGASIPIAPFYLDERWTDDERASLHEALRQWNVALNRTFVLQVIDERYHVTDETIGYTLIKIDSHNPLIHHSEQFISLAWTTGRGGGIGGSRVYFIRDRFKDDQLLPIALHEIGHVLGSEHIVYQGLMRASFDKDLYGCIDAPAVLKVARFRGLPPDKMHYCTR